jgi:hypothetical protein
MPWERRDLRRRVELTFVGSFHLKVGTQGVSIRRSVEDVTFVWSEVKEIHVEADYALLQMKTGARILVPRRGVTDRTYDGLREELERHTS